MIVGIPKEIKNNENRVGMTPAGVNELVKHGHTVYVQKGAGENSGFPDSSYERVGAKILATIENVYAISEMIVKVKEPIAPEYPLIRKGQLLFTYFHFASDRRLTEAMMSSGATCLAYETVELKDHSLPLLIPMSEVAGRMATQEGARFLERPQGGKGKLIGGVPGVKPAKVLVIGAGVVGYSAARIAAGMGADVTITDLSLPRLRHIDEIKPANIKTLYSSEFNIRAELPTTDLVVGAVLIPGAKAPHLITRDMLSTMEKGSVLVDVAIVDEATQILEPQLLGILCAKGENGKEGVGKFILIGDHKQLPAVVLQNTEQSEVYDEALSAVGLKNLKDSLFERLYRTARQHTDAHRTYDMLCRQGRMHPEVALFANQAFYEGRLLPVGLPHQLEDSGNINRLSFYPSQPEPMGSSAKTNHSEAKIAARLAATVYKEHSEAFDASRTLGIITPYRSQIALIKKEIEVLGISELNQILIDTVERFQGSERDVIIYSFCVNYPYQLKFLSNLTEEDGILIDRKLNVALTRARKQMLLTGVPTLLERNPLYKSLLKLIESLRNIA